MFSAAVLAIDLLADGPQPLLLARLAFLVTWFAILTGAAVLTSDAANASLAVFAEALVAQRSVGRQALAQSRALYQQLARPPLFLTGGRYFNVERSACLSAVSALFTLFVLVLEFDARAKTAVSDLAV